MHIKQVSSLSWKITREVFIKGRFFNANHVNLLHCQPLQYISTQSLSILGWYSNVPNVNIPLSGKTNHVTMKVSMKIRLYYTRNNSGDPTQKNSFCTCVANWVTWSILIADCKIIVDWDDVSFHAHDGPDTEATVQNKASMQKSICNSTNLKICSVYY